MTLAERYAMCCKIAEKINWHLTKGHTIIGPDGYCMSPSARFVFSDRHEEIGCKDGTITFFHAPKVTVFKGYRVVSKLEKIDIGD